MHCLCVCTIIRLQVNIPFWKRAVNEEVEVLVKNHTWELVPIIKDIKPVGCRCLSH